MREMERQTLQAERKKAAEAAAATEQTQLAAPNVSEAAATESPVISPVEESVAHSSDAPSGADTETASVADSHDRPTIPGNPPDPVPELTPTSQNTTPDDEPRAP